MSFKYINPGYGMLFSYSNFGTYENFTYNPKFGVSFYNLSDDREGYAAYTDADTADLWFKFDIYFHSAPENYRSAPEIYRSVARIIAGSKFLLDIDQRNTEISIEALRDYDNLSVEGTATKIKFDAVNTFWLHIKSAENSQLSATVIVNGETVIDGETTTSGYSGTCLASTSIKIDNSNSLPMSNLIISDSEIDLNEVIARVDSSGVDTNMAENDGEFSTVNVGDYVLQILDTSKLRSAFGDNGQVTGMVAIAAPAYSTEDYENRTIEFLTCRKIDGENVTDYDFDADNTLAFRSHSLGDETSDDIENYLPVCAEQIPIAPDTTIASLNGLKIGWVTRG